MCGGIPWGQAIFILRFEINGFGEAFKYSLFVIYVRTIADVG